MRNFQMLIASAVNIYKQCLQTASAYVGLPQIPYRGFAPGHHWGPLGYSPQMKNPGPATIDGVASSLI